MKSINKTLKQVVFILILIVLYTSCSGIDDNEPGLIIFKTKADYFNNVCIQLNENGLIELNPTYGLIYRDLDISEINDSTYFGLTRLDSGYVLAEGASYAEVNGIYLSMTIVDLVLYQKLNNVPQVPDDTLLKYVFDTDPYLEYYCDENNPRKYELTDTTEINEIIRRGELKKYFVKIK